MYYSYAQNVGIGTKNPQNKLHIAGGLRIDSLAGKNDSGVILHNKSGDVFSLKLTGNKTDVLRGDGTFAAATTAANAWLLHGNAGTDTSNFLGTTDASALQFRVNNIPAGQLHPVNGNIALGLNSLQLNSTGYSNIAIGSGALHDNTEGFNQVAIGDSALFHQGQNEFPSYSNTAVGSKVLYQLTQGIDNTVIGWPMRIPS